MQSALGVSTHMGWACVAAVLVEAGVPVGVRTFRLETGDPAHPESMEPYHAAGGYRGVARVRPPPDPVRVVREGLRRQRRHTEQHLDRLLRQLADWSRPQCAALLVGRGKQAPDLERVLASHAQIHVAEGNAVRDSVRRAMTRSDIIVVDIDRRELGDQVRLHLSLDEAQSAGSLKALKPDNNGVWRQEERQCALAAWLALRLVETSHQTTDDGGF